MAALTPLEEKAVKEFIYHVNEIRQQQNAGPLPWNTAVKFMMARKFDVSRALALYHSHHFTRLREGLARFDPTSEPLKSELEAGKFTILPARDSSGACLALFTASKHIPSASNHQATLQALVFQLDVALDSLETQRCGIVFVYNMTNSKYSNFDYELSQKILNLLKGGYPARLKKVLIVAAPLWFKAPFRILRLFVKEKLRDRVYMLKLPQLFQHIPPSSLPCSLGGTLNLDHKAWLLHCLKSRTNCYNDLCDLVLTTYCSQSFPTTTSITSDIHSNGGIGSAVSEVEEEEEEEDITPPTSVHEKQNSEEREKEVEVTKDESPREKNVIEIRQAGDPPPSDNGSLTLEEFIEHLRQKGRRGLYEEYQNIKANDKEGTFEVAKMKCNQQKNRYTDVLCFDHSRVKLSTPPIDHCDDDTSDYINANFVDGYCQKKAFISTQGPLPKTYEAFWQMVWEQHVGVIVMTTRTVERSRAKCGQYWPREPPNQASFGPFTVTNCRVEHCPDYIVTFLTLKNTESEICRTVVHLQFVSWPDYGVPHSALAMLDFRDRVLEHQSQLLATLDSGSPEPPILIHCSAGIGRTGTFITLDICIKELEDTGRINVRRTVEKIRSQRAHSIQMPDQYVFCHLALLEYALSRGLLEDVDLSGFNDSESESEA